VLGATQVEETGGKKEIRFLGPLPMISELYQSGTEKNHLRIQSGVSFDLIKS
jgi:hypothetical protein